MRMRMIFVYTCIALLIFSAEPGQASEESVYQSRQSFVDYAFKDGAFKDGAFNSGASKGRAPLRQKLWIRGQLKNDLTQVLGHAPPWLRVGYWQRGSRTAWILEEIGKDQPITAGVVVADGKIELVRVLVYRESRGYEVRYPFFTDQFQQASLDKHNRLDLSIDGITGATLSVSALKRMARAALLLHAHSANPKITLAKK